jgi:pimeloyl-ACP methyl ester carboxylesterase
MHDPGSANGTRRRRWSGEVARERALEGVPVEDLRLPLAGMETAVLEGGDGPPVVLLHGAGELSLLWMRIIPALVHTHRVIAPDLPGHGATDVPAEGPPDAERVQAWLGELIGDRCAQPPVLVGHLLGGAIAARFAIAHPDRVRALVLTDSTGLGPFRPSLRFALAMAGFVARPTARSQERLFRGCFADLDDVRSGVGTAWEPLAAYALERARSPALQGTLRRLMPSLVLKPIAPEALARLSVPVALIWGRNDVQVRLRVAEAASARYGWRLHVIDGAGDDPAFERPAEFLAALRASLGAVAEQEVAS